MNNYEKLDHKYKRNQVLKLVIIVLCACISLSGLVCAGIVKDKLKNFTSKTYVETMQKVEEIDSVEEKLEEKKDDIVKEKQEKKIALGRIIEDGEEDEDGINAADYFYTKVMFDVVALYNPTCDTNEAFMEGTNKALIEHRAEREEALKQRQAEKEAKKALEEDKN